MNIKIVLVDTQDGANIGSVCRAMKTMGICRLALVSARSYEEERIKTLSLSAFDIWEKAERHTSLEDAVKNSVFTVGATRRIGKFRKGSSYSPRQLAEKVVKINGEVSLVFGRESDGLKDSEVSLLSSIVTIPSSEMFFSLNLSHAVEIICYEIFLASLNYKPGKAIITHERAKKAGENITDNLKNIGYFKTRDEERLTGIFLKDVIERAEMSESDVKKFEKIFFKTEKIALHRRKDE